MSDITPTIDFSTDLTGLFDMSGQVAYLPGGYGGIGEAIAWGLAIHGAKVVVAGRSLEKAEALAGAIAGALNNIRVVHIEGGEVSGTIDESIRHAISKMAHIHLVANDAAERRLIQMGEAVDSIFKIGSPEVDVMLSDELPSLDAAKKRYGIKFDDFALLVYHPVTTERENHEKNVSEVIRSIERSGHNYIAIRANNDLGSDHINKQLGILNKSKKVKVFPSLRFEYYLTFLKHARYIIGNSSSGVREAPVYGVPCINIGSRQSNRNDNPAILNVSEDTSAIVEAIESLPKRFSTQATFGDGQAAGRFLELMNSDQFWAVATQKKFFDRPVAD